MFLSAPLRLVGNEYIARIRCCCCCCCCCYCCCCSCRCCCCYYCCCSCRCCCCCRRCCRCCYCCLLCCSLSRFITAITTKKSSYNKTRAFAAAAVAARRKCATHESVAGGVDNSFFGRTPTRRFFSLGSLFFTKSFLRIGLFVDGVTPPRHQSHGTNRGLSET